MTEIIDKVVMVLKKGGVILYPTQTLYGLGCDPFNSNSVKKIYEIKGRKEDKPFLHLVGSKEMLTRFGAKITEIHEKLINSFWPGPLTIIFPVDSTFFKSKEVAFRIDPHPFLKKLFEKWEYPLVSTSANFHGTPPPSSFEEISDKIKKSVEIAIKSDIPLLNKPSTVIRVISDKVEVLREGAVKKVDIEKILGKNSCV